MLILIIVELTHNYFHQGNVINIVFSIFFNECELLKIDEDLYLCNLYFYESYENLHGYSSYVNHGQ